MAVNNYKTERGQILHDSTDEVIKVKLIETQSRIMFARIRGENEIIMFNSYYISVIKIDSF